MRRTIVLAVLLASGCAEPPPPLPPGPGAAPAAESAAPAPPAVPEHFRLIFTREKDGRWKFLRCRLEIDVGVGPAPVRLTCEPRDGAAVRARSELGAAQAEELRTVLEQAAIYEPPHAGGLVHWRFETITLRPVGLGPEEEHAVVLVVSGNESFKAGARGRLLYTLWRLQDELEARVQ